MWVITECYPRPTAPCHCIFAHRQTVGLRRSGWDVSVLIPNGWYPAIAWPLARKWRGARRRSIPKEWAPDGMSISDLVYANPIPSRLSGARNHLELIIRALDARVREADQSPSVFLSQFALPLGPAVRDVAKRFGIPYAVYLRGDDVWIWPHQSPGKMSSFVDVVGDAALVLAVSNSILSEARRISGLPLGRSMVLPNGIDLTCFQPALPGVRNGLRDALRIAPDCFVVMCVASALRRKGWPELLDAVGLFGDRDVVLLAVTAGPDELDLAAECEQRAPRARLIIQKGLTASALARLYGAADVFCLPSHWEGMSNALLEAMACGLPVVTTPVGGHPEVVTGGIEGSLVAVGSAEELHAALDAFARHPNAAKRAGQAGRRRAEAVGTPDESGRRLGELISGVVDKTLPQVLPPVAAYGGVEAIA